jgi:uncharacterized protein (DUF2147 family)
MKWLVALAMSLASTAALAAGETANLSPVGNWQTIDDNSGKPRALVRIVELNGELSGTIEKIYSAPGEDPAPRCVKCTDSRRDQPVLGMTFLNGLKKDAEPLVWSGGEILDPDNGSVYRSRATLSEDGTKLQVRGYIGIALLGRTQVWKRVP